MSLVDQKCRAWLEGQGYRVAKVEHFNSFTKRKHDLFGFVDFLAVGHGETVAIQATSRQHVGERVTKARAQAALPDLLAAGWKVAVVGFEKGKRAPVRVEEL